MKVDLENGMRFLTNFKYTVKPEVSSKPESEPLSEFAGIKSGDYNKFDSLCDKTMVGFVMNIPSITNKVSTMQSHDVKCFFGV